MIDPLAVAAHRALGAIFMEMPEEWIPEQLLVLHRVHRVELTSWFAKNRGLAELVTRNGEQLYKTVSEPADILDPLTLKNVAGLFALLLDLYVPALPALERARVQSGLENALQKCTAALTQAVDGEVVALAELFGNIVAVLNALPGFKGHGRVILPELPVGNSIPCKLLRPVLERAGYTVDTLLVSLSRNDARSKGVRREDLLEEKLTAFGLRENDLVLYLDEWFSGVNYARICACLDRLLRTRPNVQLLPA